MIRVILSPKNQHIVLHCEFCNAYHEYPFVVHTVWPDAENPVLRTNPDAQSIIYSHLTGDANLKELGFRECLQVFRWHTTEWQLIEAETEKILSSGRLVVTPSKQFAFE